MKNARRSVIAGMSAVLVSAVLAACAPMPADDTAREASRRDSRLCIQNETSMQMRVQWRGYPAPIDIARGETQCNTGYETLKYDIEATIEYQPEDDPGNWLSLRTVADNRIVGLPSGAVWYEQQDYKYGVCGNFSVGDTRTFQTFMFRADLTRQNDSADHKEFSLSFTGPVGPNSADEVTRCLTPRPPL
jgi:hypothetical protein